MPREKLILICQSGGEFVTNDDGSLSYNGGEAHALDINIETVFDDLKLKLAEMCNLEYESLSMKYFIPGNKRTLITVSSDKDLKRVFDFHGNSITADVFVMGREVVMGFSLFLTLINSSFKNYRGSGIQLAETVLSPVPITVAPAAAAFGGRRVLSSKSKRAAKDKAQSRAPSCLAVTTPTVTPATVASGSRRVLSSKTANAANAEAKSPASVALAIISKQSPATITKDPGVASLIPTDLVTVPVDTTVHDSVTVDMNTSPADTVKKRRRIASWNISANGPSIVLDDNDDNNDNTDDVNGETRSTSRKTNTRTRKSTSRKKNAWDHDNAFVDVEIEWQSDNEDSELCVHGVNSKDVSVERMVASWKKRITGVGQDFKDVAEFRDALQKYSIARRFAYRLKKNDTNRASGRCVVEGCSWRIHASWVESEQVFRIKKMNKSHTCEGESWKRATPNKNWLVSIIKDRLRQTPQQKPKDIANGLFQDFGVALNYSQVWRGIEDAKEQLQGSKKEAYNMLPWFCDKIVEANPGSFVKLSVDDDSKFQCLFGPFHGDGKVSLPGSLVAAAHAVRLDGFRMHTEQIKRISSKVYDWLMQIEPECWTNALFKGERYNHITVDVAATYTDWIEEVRELPIIRKLEALTCKIMGLIRTCQMDSNGWTAKLTPSKEKKLQEDALRAQFLKVLFSSDTLFESIHPVLDNFKDLAEEKEVSGSVQVLPPNTPRPPIQPEEKRYYYRKGEPTRSLTDDTGKFRSKGSCRYIVQQVFQTSFCNCSSTNREVAAILNAEMSNQSERSFLLAL
ncbi:hypothetical protein D5086_012310 [Populus alba]|uniref:Uncharacterized protein n=1 Tax=Populus alba TaxID=43335 RepID=A0ACC4C2H9_POPAL